MTQAKPTGPPPGPNDDVYVEQLPEAIFKVAPEYPETPRQSNVQGTVIVKALVGADRNVKNTVVVKSVPMLDDAAQAAVPVRFSLK